MKLRRIDLAVSIIAAIALWFYVVNILNPPITVQFRDVPITITGEADLENSGLALREGTELKTTVSVKGPRNVVNGVRTEDIILTVDVSALEKGQATAPVHAQLPSGVSLGELQSPNVELTVEELVSVAASGHAHTDGGHRCVQPGGLSGFRSCQRRSCRIRA